MSFLLDPTNSSSSNKESCLKFKSKIWAQTPSRELWKQSGSDWNNKLPWWCRGILNVFGKFRERALLQSSSSKCHYRLRKCKGSLRILMSMQCLMIRTLSVQWLLLIVWSLAQSQVQDSNSLINSPWIWSKKRSNITRTIWKQNRTKEINHTFTHHPVILTTSMIEQEIQLLIMGPSQGRTFIQSINNSPRYWIHMATTFWSLLPFNYPNNRFKSSPRKI